MTNLKHHLPISFWICLVSSIILIVVGFVIEPPGQVHQSVLTAVGELLLFPALATINHAIDKGTDVKIKHNNTEVELDNPDSPNNPNAKSQF